MRVYRKLFPTEAQRLRDHLLRLDAVDRHRRFFAGISDAAVEEHCRRIDWLRTLVIGCFEDGVLRGAAEVALDGGTFPRQAELALSIEGPWQDQGIGTQLMRRAILAATNRAVVSLYMLCLSENRRMQSIAKKFDARLGFADGEADAQLDVPPPTQLSLAAEALGRLRPLRAVVGCRDAARCGCMSTVLSWSPWPSYERRRLPGRRRA